MARTLELLWNAGATWVAGALGLFALVFFLGELRGAPRPWTARILATARKALIATVGLVVVGGLPALVGLASGSWLGGLVAPLVLAVAVDHALAARPPKRDAAPFAYARVPHRGGAR